MRNRRVVITGMGAVTPVGLTARESWQNVKLGVCGVGPITQFDATGMKVQLAAEVKGFEPEAVLDRQSARRMAALPSSLWLPPGRPWPMRLGMGRKRIWTGAV